MNVDDHNLDRLPRSCHDHVLAGRWREAIREYVASHDWVTFTELQQSFGAFFPAKGELSLGPNDFPNIVFWSGMSSEFAEILSALLSSGELVVRSASVLTYLVDGGMLRLPVLKRMPKGGPKKPYWLPVCLRTKEQAQKQERKRGQRRQRQAR